MLELEKRLLDLEKEFNYSVSFYSFIKEFALNKLNETEESPLNNLIEDLIDSMQDCIWDCFDDYPRLLYLKDRLNIFLEVIDEYLRIAGEE